MIIKTQSMSHRVLLGKDLEKVKEILDAPRGNTMVYFNKPHRV